MASTTDHRRARLELVRQLEIADCGAACLTTVLRAHGSGVGLAEVRDLTSTGRDGVSARTLLSAARHHGLAGQGVRCAPRDLPELPRGSILHWAGNHFVVLDGPTRDGVRIVDPALGRRTVGREAFAAQATGVALTFPPLPERAARRRPRRPTAHYRPFLRPEARPGLALLGLAALLQVFTLVEPLVVRSVVGDLSGSRGERLSPAVVLAVLGILSVTFALAGTARLLVTLGLQQRVDLALTMGVLRHLVSLPAGVLARRASGDLALRVRSTVVVRQIVTVGALSALVDGTLVLVYLGLIAVVDVPFALLTVGIAAVQGTVVALGWSRLTLASSEALATQTVAQSRLLEIVEGLVTLKAAGAGERAVEAWAEQLRAEVRAHTAAVRLGGLVELALATVRFAAPLLLLTLGLARVQSGDLSLGDMLALTALGAAVTIPIGSLLGTLTSLTAVVGYLDRLDDVLLARPEPSGGRPPRTTGAPAITTERLGFSYSALLPPALRDVTLDIAPGSHVAIVGASGSGKSTLALLLAGLHDPTLGALRLDGVDRDELDLRLVREGTGVVTQDARLFQQTIRDNITFGRNGVTQAQVVRAARIAAVHEEVAGLPSGYGTLLGNGGSGLSGGQQQRILLARAVLGSPGLLVLDEATSALDPATDLRVHQALAELTCTRIVVAHRMSTVALAERVIVLRDGEVVADGSFAALRRRSPDLRALVAGTSA